MLKIEDIFDQYFETVYRFVFFRLYNKEETEDLTSEIFMKIVKNFDSYHDQAGASVLSWIMKITRNALVDYYRKKKIYLEPIENIEKADLVSLEEKIDQKMQLELVFAALKKLPSRQKEIALLRFEVGLSNKEIAELLEIETSTVSASISRIRQFLNLSLKNFNI
jgi:RNA polymerase sigma-70 factor (ECF subfamily)